MRYAPARAWRLLALIVIAGLVLSGCNNASPEAATATPPPPTAAAAGSTSVATDTPELAAKMSLSAAAVRTSENGPLLDPSVSGTVELWHFWGSPVRHNALRRVISACQQQLPNIKVNDTVKPVGEIWTSNLATVAAGAGMPDVIVSDRRTLPREAADGVYMSLQPWADRDNVRRDQFYNWAWDQGVYNGEIYGIPHETDVTVLFYNKDLFRQAGLDPDRPPATWDDLERYADKLDKIGPDGKLERVAFFPLWVRGVDVWQYTNDADMIGPDGTPRSITRGWCRRWNGSRSGWIGMADGTGYRSSATSSATRPTTCSCPQPSRCTSTSSGITASSSSTVLP